MHAWSVTSLVMLALLQGDFAHGTLSQASSDPPGFVQVLPSEVKWNPNPKVPGGEIAVLMGDLQKEGPVVVRVRFQAGARVMPHTHREARTYTVLAGVWKIGFGEEFDAATLRSFPAGSMYRLPARVAHFQAAGDAETIVQIESDGPSSTDFINTKKQ